MKRLLTHTALAAGQLLFDIEHRCARTSIA